jgi:hypothetical protein
VNFAPSNFIVLPTFSPFLDTQQSPAALWCHHLEILRSKISGVISPDPKACHPFPLDFTTNNITVFSVSKFTSEDFINCTNFTKCFHIYIWIVPSVNIG